MINSHQYWNERFSSKDWEKRSGDQQSVFFAEIACNAFPAWLTQELTVNQWALYDYGCATGSGTAVLAKSFPNCQVTGVDFSQAAINAAKAQHPTGKYIVGDITQNVINSDVIFCSNTLEHFHEPMPIFQSLVNHSFKHTILLIPFEDDSGESEHFTKFSAAMFPDAVSTHYLHYFQIIDCISLPGTLWKGKQLLLVYTNQNHQEKSDHSIGDLYQDSLLPLLTQNEQLRIAASSAQLEMQRMQNEIKPLQESNLRLQHEASSAQAKVQQLQEMLLTMQAEKQQLQSAVHTMQAENQRLQKEVAAAKTENPKLQNEIRAAYAETQKLQNQVDAAELKYSEMLEKFNRLWKNSEEMKVALENQEAENKTLHTAMIQSQLIRSQPSTELASLQAENDKLQSELTFLESGWYQQQQALQKQLRRLEQETSKILCTCDQVQAIRSYKLAHLLGRFRNQFLKGSTNDRRAYAHWLFGHMKRDFVDDDHAYNPVFRVIEPMQKFSVMFADMEANIVSNNQKKRIIQQHMQEIITADLSHPDILKAAQIEVELIELLSNYSGDYVCILAPVVDYEIELFQRPQQIALALSSVGILSVYITINRFDNVETVKVVQDNLVLIPNNLALVRVIQAVKAQGKKALVQVYSTDMRLSADDIQNVQQLADVVVYEYIDEISAKITGTVPDFVRERHRMILADPAISVISTASKLHEEVTAARHGEINCLLSSNGVDLEHFQKLSTDKPLPADFAGVVAKNKPIVGYFGAIANWMNFTLIRDAALARPDYEFVLIGPKYIAFDHSFLDMFQELDNVTFCNPIPHQDLPSAAKHFSIATIPFTVDEITESTSPIKIFEYMAMKKPVVTTEMRECHQYPVYVAQNTAEYIQMLDRAMADRNNPDIQAKLLACAQTHTWQAKAMDVIHAGFPHSETKMEWIFLAAIDWDFRYQRPQQLASILAQGGDHVTYCNTDTHETFCQERRQKVDLIKFGRINTSLRSIFYLNSEQDAHILFAQLDDHLTEQNIRTANVVVQYPTWYPLAKLLQEKYDFHIYFDYIDEYTGFTSTKSNRFLVKGTQWLKENSKAIFASSQYLYDRIGNTQASKHLIQNGTDSRTFSKARGAAGNKPQVIGYYGAVADWFDASLIAYAAKQLPEYHFMIVGDYTYGNVSELSRLSNVELTGEVPYQRLPAILHLFDVCLIPFKSTLELIQATNPVKFYEYLSAGKKVVATEIPELEPFRDKYVLMSNQPEGFVDAIRRCLENRDGLADENERIAFGCKNDWHERANVMRKAVSQTYPKMSVVVLTWNNAKYNIGCIRSIYDYSAYPNLEIIAVDNASEDDTPARLKGMAYAFPNLKIILNQENLGFAKGMNLGIKAATGDYIVLLNNDTIVTAGWLSGLRHYLHDEKIGAVGSVTNTIGNEAKIIPGYRDINGIQHFAVKRSQAHAGECFDIRVLALFCTMFRRSTIQEIGLLDEQFEVGMFEDDDYSLRLQAAGYRTVCATDVFIHHYGMSGFKLITPARYSEIFNINKKKFEHKHRQKWQKHKNA